MRRRLGRIVGALALALAPTLALHTTGGTSSAVAQAEDAELGRDLYVQSCASCHGADANGTSQGPPLRGVGAASLDFMLSTGRMPLADPSMQPVRTEPAFTVDEIGAIVAYVTSLEPGGTPIPSVDADAGDVAAGRAVFANNCLACHGAAGQGASVGAGQIAPSLEEATPTQIGEAVRVGPGAMPRFGEETIDERDVDSLAAYLVAIRAGQNPGGAGLGHAGPVAEGFVAVLVGLGLVLLVMRFAGTKR